MIPAAETKSPRVINHPSYGAYLEDKWVPAPRYLLKRDRILKYLAKKPTGKILDIGCGASAMLLDFKQIGLQPEGLENADEARDVAKHFLKNTNIPLHVTPKENFVSRYDYLVSCDVLEHIEDDHTAFSEWTTWLKPGGKVVIAVPAFMSKMGPHDVWAGHYRRYERDTLENLMKAGGIEIESIESFGFPITTVTHTLRHIVAKRSNKSKVDTDDKTAKEINTASSGVDRTLETKLFPIQCSLFGKAIIGSGKWIQSKTVKANIGDGLIVYGTKK